MLAGVVSADAPTGVSPARPDCTFGFAGDLVARYRDIAGYDESFAAYLSGFSARFGLTLHEGCRFTAELSHVGYDLACEEAYLSWSNVGRGDVRLGQFRQAFGHVNEFSRHDLDWTQYPLALRYLLGGYWSGSVGRLTQAGLSYELDAPSGSLAVQLTGGTNDRVFSNNSYGLPSILVRGTGRLGTALELGVSGLLGWNDEWYVAGEYAHDVRPASAVCLDFRLRSGRSLRWETELYAVSKEILREAGSDILKPWGAYTSVWAGITPDMELGLRCDYYRPEVRPFNHYEYTSSEEGAHRWLASVRLAWRMSNHFTLGIEYSHSDGAALPPPLGIGEGAEDVVTLQYVFKWGWETGAPR